MPTEAQTSLVTRDLGFTNLQFDFILKDWSCRHCKLPRRQLRFHIKDNLKCFQVLKPVVIVHKRVPHCLRDSTKMIVDRIAFDMT